MSALGVQQRVEILRTLLDEMRRRLAIQTDCLDREKQQPLNRRAREYLNERWSFDEEERLRYAPLFVLPGSELREGDAGLSRRSLIGRWLVQRTRETLGRD